MGGSNEGFEYESLVFGFYVSEVERFQGGVIVEEGMFLGVEVIEDVVT